MNIADLDLAATFAAFDQAESDGDLALCAALLDRARELTGQGSTAEAVTAAAAAPASVPTSVYLSTSVIAPDAPRAAGGDGATPRCGVCRSWYPGSDARASLIEAHGVLICHRCAARKPALVT
jgi:hypothetical protein